MLSRQALTRAAQPVVARAAPSGARNMATLREIEMRLKSVRNIEKITKVRRVTALLRPTAHHKTPRANAVDEVDCVDEAQQGAARFAGGQGVWSG